MTTVDRKHKPLLSIAGMRCALMVLVFSLAWSAGAHAQGWDRGRTPPVTPSAGSSPRGDDQPNRPHYGRWAPGQTLPPDAQAVVLTDYEHYHLRRPPRGYVWLFCDGDYILAASASGRIFDVVPAASQ